MGSSLRELVHTPHCRSQGSLSLQPGEAFDTARQVPDSSPEQHEKGLNLGPSLRRNVRRQGLTGPTLWGIIFSGLAL